MYDTFVKTIQQLTHRATPYRRSPMFQTKMGTSLIRGSVASGFEEVERAFTKNFSERGELGAACAVYHQGKKVVDLWGGYRDAKSQAPWEEDTLVLVFSVTKGMAAMTMALAHSQGHFFQHEIAQPLGLEFYIGLPAEVPTSRVAPIKGFHAREMVFHMDAMPLKMVMAYMNPNSLTRRTLGNPKFSSPVELDRPEYRAVELAAGGGIGQARSIAKAYSVFALGGKELGLTQETFEALTQPSTTPL